MPPLLAGPCGGTPSGERRTVDIGCGCGAKAATALASVQTYEIEGDPQGIKYLTERDAINEKESRGLDGAVVPSA